MRDLREDFQKEKFQNQKKIIELEKKNMDLNITI